MRCRMVQTLEIYLVYQFECINLVVSADLCKHEYNTHLSAMGLKFMFPSTNPLCRTSMIITIVVVSFERPVQIFLECLGVFVCTA